MLAKCDKTKFSQFVGIARQIWLRRNELIHGGPFLHPNIIAQQAIRATEDMQALEDDLKSKNAILEVTAATTWKASPFGFLKANWDASVDRKRRRVGLGVVIQDHCGKMWVSKCMTRDGILDPMSAEAMVAIVAAQFCKELGMR